MDPTGDTSPKTTPTVRGNREILFESVAQQYQSSLQAGLTKLEGALGRKLTERDYRELQTLLTLTRENPSYNQLGGATMPTPPNAGIFAEREESLRKLMHSARARKAEAGRNGWLFVSSLDALGPVLRSAQTAEPETGGWTFAKGLCFGSGALFPEALRACNQYPELCNQDLISATTHQISQHEEFVPLIQSIGLALQEKLITTGQIPILLKISKTLIEVREDEVLTPLATIPSDVAPLLLFLTQILGANIENPLQRMEEASGALATIHRYEGNLPRRLLMLERLAYVARYDPNSFDDASSCDSIKDYGAELEERIEKRRYGKKVLNLLASHENEEARKLRGTPLECAYTHAQRMWGLNQSALPASLFTFFTETPGILSSLTLQFLGVYMDHLCRFQDNFRVHSNPNMTDENPLAGRAERSFTTAELFEELSSKGATVFTDALRTLIREIKDSEALLAMMGDDGDRRRYIQDQIVSKLPLS